MGAAKRRRGPNGDKCPFDAAQVSRIKEIEAAMAAADLGDIEKSRQNCDLSACSDLALRISKPGQVPPRRSWELRLAWLRKVNGWQQDLHKLPSYRAAWPHGIEDIEAIVSWRRANPA